MSSKLGIYAVKRSNKKKKSVFENLDDFIKTNYVIQFNESGLKYEIARKGSDLKIQTLNEDTLYVAMVNAGQDLSQRTLEIYLKSDYVTRYNPIANYFNKLSEWDGIDHIKKFASYVHTDDDDQFAYHLKKWCVRAIRSIFDKEKINKHCIVLANGEQHAGKSTYINYLIPKELKPFSSENIGLDKDSRIKLCKTFIINIEELDVMGKYDVNSLKAFISQTWVNERLPYARRSENIPRISSFIASTNRTEFLNDNTGSVRWIVFEVKGRLDFSYNKKGQQLDINKLWTQAKHLADDKSFDAELTAQDVLANEKRNAAYTIQSLEDELVRTLYTRSDSMEDFKTPTEVVVQLRPLGHNLNNVKIGGALKGAGFKRVSNSKRGDIYGYLAKANFKKSPLEIK